MCSFLRHFAGLLDVEWVSLYHASQITPKCQEGCYLAGEVANVPNVAFVFDQVCAWKNNSLVSESAHAE